MKIGTMAKTNERRKKTILGIVLITVLCAIIFSNLLELLIKFITWVIKLMIKHWVKILIGIAVILIGRKILFRAKRK